MTTVNFHSEHNTNHDVPDQQQESMKLEKNHHSAQTRPTNDPRVTIYYWIYTATIGIISMGSLFVSLMALGIPHTIVHTVQNRTLGFLTLSFGLYQLATFITLFTAFVCGSTLCYRISTGLMIVAGLLEVVVMGLTLTPSGPFYAWLRSLAMLNPQRDTTMLSLPYLANTAAFLLTNTWIVPVVMITIAITTGVQCGLILIKFRGVFSMINIDKDQSPDDLGIENDKVNPKEEGSALSMSHQTRQPQPPISPTSTLSPSTLIHHSDAQNTHFDPEDRDLSDGNLGAEYLHQSTHQLYNLYQSRKAKKSSALAKNNHSLPLISTTQMKQNQRLVDNSGDNNNGDYTMIDMGEIPPTPIAPQLGRRGAHQLSHNNQSLPQQLYNDVDQSTTASSALPYSPSSFPHPISINKGVLSPPTHPAIEPIYQFSIRKNSIHPSHRPSNNHPPKSPFVNPHTTQLHASIAPHSSLDNHPQSVSSTNNRFTNFEVPFSPNNLLLGIQEQRIADEEDDDELLIHVDSSPESLSVSFRSNNHLKNAKRMSLGPKGNQARRNQANQNSPQKNRRRYSSITQSRNQVVEKDDSDDQPLLSVISPHKQRFCVNTVVYNHLPHQHGARKNSIQNQIRSFNSPLATNKSHNIINDPNHTQNNALSSSGSEEGVRIQAVSTSSSSSPLTSDQEDDRTDRLQQNKFASQLSNPRF